MRFSERLVAALQESGAATAPDVVRSIEEGEPPYHRIRQGRQALDRLVEKGEVHRFYREGEVLYSIDPPPVCPQCRRAL